MRVLSRVAAVLLLLGMWLGVLAAPAMADESLQITVPGGAMTFDRLAPGVSRTAGITLANGSDSQAEVVLRSLDVRDLENGCIRQETRDGDSSCDEDGGELGDWLTVSVAHEGTTLWAGSLRDLDDGVTIASTLPAGDTWDLDVTVGLPAAAGNDTMTDRVEFDLRWTASAETGESDTAILGVDAVAPGSGSGGFAVSGIGLPFTGTGVSPLMLAIAAALLCGGFVLIRYSRRPSGEAVRVRNDRR